MANGCVKRVVVFVQENHTVDHYFGGLAPWGARVATGWPRYPATPPSPPYSPYYPPHDRTAYYEWLTRGTADHTQVDTAADLPYYLYLAVTGAFLENHCAGFGTNSTPNHLLLVGGQSPTLTNPPLRSEVRWDMPSVPGVAEANGRSWRCYAPGGYPVKYYRELHGSANIVPPAQFVADAKAGTLPELVYVWHPTGLDEHPPSNITVGMQQIWQAVDAVVTAGGWDETVFMLTWDDWGGFDDHVPTPVTEYTPDNVQLAYGPRIPLLVFGGHVKPGIDSRWCSHVSVPKTVLALLGLPPLGVPRLDDAPGLSDLIDCSRPAAAPPPGYGAAITIPAAPAPAPSPAPLPPPPVIDPIPVPAVRLRDGTTLPAPYDVPLPLQPQPPHN
jgi:hypothetical protein